MTELYINGVQAILPNDMSTEVKIENSFFTKNGEYTYDLTLKLNNETNNRLYEHLNRLNSIQELTENRVAILIADNRVYCQGTEIITGWTDEDVTIQIASGNSELNYFINSDVLISSLDLGKALIPASGLRNTHLNIVYPETDFSLAPVRNGDTTINPWDVVITQANEGEVGVLSYEETEDGTYIPQPYLCALLEKIITALGYTITLNQLAQSPWRFQVICHNNNTTEYAKMVAGWSVLEFLEECERLYDLVFVIDSKKRTVRIMFSGSYYSNASVVYLQNVKDEYETDADEDEESAHSMANIGYKLADNDYYNRRRLPDVLLSKGIKITLANYQAIWNYIYSGSATGYDIITDSETGIEYIRKARVKANRDGSTTTSYYPEPVNEFKNLIRDQTEDSLDIEIAFMPVPLLPVSFNYKRIIGGQASNIVETAYITATISTESSSSESEEEIVSESLDDYLTNDNYNTSETKGNIYLGFYSGIKYQRVANSGSTSNGLTDAFPTIYTDEVLNKNFADYKEPKDTHSIMSVEGESMRLSILDKELYTRSYNINRKKAYTFECFDPNLYDVRAIFVIGNKRFVCKEMDFTLNATGRKMPWKSVFYPISISDTEAYQRWLLTDAKWRDGGVWLDSGRWLDE